MSSRTLRSLPAAIDGYGAVDAFCGRCRVPPVVTCSARPLVPAAAGGCKRLASLDAAFDACGVADGATLSFHHHLRNGDQVLNQELAAAARRGLRGLTVAASSLFPVHAPLVGPIERGVVARLVTSYMSGPVAEAVSAGAQRAPVVMQTHGGRAAAIASGRLAIVAGVVGRRRGDERHVGRCCCAPGRCCGSGLADAPEREPASRPARRRFRAMIAGNARLEALQERRR